MSELAYLQLLEHTCINGERRDDRTGVGCWSVHAPQLRFDLTQGFPLLTTKHVSFHNVKHELLWMLSGSTNVKDLHAHNVHIWDEWADENGELGPVYGMQWRAWMGLRLDSPEPPFGLDQITALIQGLRDNPDSRRHIVTAWNPVDLPEQSLPPCHCLFQCFTHPDSGLSLHMYQRSADLFLGVPYNIASYALLLHLLAAVTNRAPRELVISFGDAHVYCNHADAVDEQLARAPYNPPALKILSPPDEFLQNVDYRSLVIEGYEHHPAIKAEIAI